VLAGTLLLNISRILKKIYPLPQKKYLHFNFFYRIIYFLKNSIKQRETKKEREKKEKKRKNQIKDCVNKI